MSNVNPKDCLFAAELELNERSSETAKTAPFSMVARSGRPINHHHWGPIVHDNSGAQFKKRIPIDFNHDVNEIVGFGNKISVDDEGNLSINGFLTPYKDNDRATEILHKAELGVPWEASINFAGDMVLERFEEGETVEVNGHEFDGPMTVVREWQLRGVAITPYGYDSSTSTQFTESSNINITYINKDTTDMKPEAELSAEVTEEVAVDAVELEAPEAEVTEEVAVDAELEASVEETAEENAELCGCDEECEDCEEATEALKAAEEAPEEAPAEEAAPEAELEAPGQAFMSLFGETEGAVYFAKGISLDAAKDLEIARLRSENEELRSRVVEVATSGEESPVGFSAPDAKSPMTGLPVSIQS